MTLSRSTLFKSLMLVAMLVALTAVLLYGRSSAPPTGYSNCFGEFNCTECHSGTINTGPGSFNIGAEPLDSGETLFTEGYVVGHPYSLFTVLTQQGQARWGFQLVARFEGTQQQAGHFEVGPDNYTSLQSFAHPVFGMLEYIGHTALGTRSGVPNGPVAFSFKWTAPTLAEIPPDNTRIVFCGVGNAADNDFSPDGDYIYSKSITVSPNPTWFPLDEEDEGDPLGEDDGSS